MILQPTSYLFTITFISMLFIGIGIFMLAKKTHLIIHNKFFFLIMTFSYFPKIINSIKMLQFHETDFIVGFLIIIIFAILASLAYDGYIALGINVDDFNNQINLTLNKLEFKYQQYGSLIRINKPSLEINISNHSSWGSSHIRFQGKGNKANIHKIIGSLQKSSIKLNRTTPILYITLGIVMSAVVIILKMINIDLHI